MKIKISIFVFLFFIFGSSYLFLIFSCGKASESDESSGNIEKVSINNSTVNESLKDSLQGQQWDTTIIEKLSPGGKDNIVKIHSTFFPESKKQKWTELKYTLSIDGKEKEFKIVSTVNIFLQVKTIDIDNSDDYKHLLIYNIIDDPDDAGFPYYSEYLFICNEAPEIAKHFYGKEPITYGDGLIYYFDSFGFGKVKRKCTIENNKFREIHEEEYPVDKNDGEVTDPFTIYSKPDINSSVVEKTFLGEKVSIIACNLDEYNPNDDDENGHSVIWIKIKTEKGKTGWANKASGRIKGKGIKWYG